MTIEELLAATGLTANDLVPIYDAEAAQSVEPTQKITAAQFAAAVKTLANLQGKLTFDSTPTTGSTNPVTSGGVANAIAQSTAINDPSLLTGFDASKRIAFTPTSGQSQTSYGGCWYGKIGTRVYLHIGMTGLTANAAPVTVFTLPAGYRPIADMICLGTGGASYTSIAIMFVNTAGVVRVNSQDAYARIDMMFDALS